MYKYLSQWRYNWAEATISKDNPFKQFKQAFQLEYIFSVNTSQVKRLYIV